MNREKPHLETSLSTLVGVNVALVSTVPFFVITQLKPRIERLAQAGANVFVICSDGPELKMLRRELPQVRYVTIKIVRPISLLLDLSAVFRLFLFFMREHIQIVHSTTPKAGLITALAAFFARVPVRLHTFTGQFWVRMRGVNRWLGKRIDKLIGYLNTRCYADSMSQREFLIAQQVIDKDRLFVIGSGSLVGVEVQRFDSERFDLEERMSIRQSLSIPKDASVLLFAGRISVDKGVRELLQAFQIVKATVRDVHLVFVGKFEVDSGVPADKISRDEIERLSNTHIVGYSDCPERYMAIADIFCLPSYREGFGTSVIEAAVMSVPTVGTDIYGLSDAIVNGETGMLVPPYDVQELAKAINILLADKLLRDKMGEAAKLRARGLFDADLVNRLAIEEYIKLLQTKM